MQQKQGCDLGDSQSLMGQGPWSPALLTLLEQGVGLGDLWRSLPPLTILWFCDICIHSRNYLYAN